MAYREEFEGRTTPPLVFVHGLGLSSRSLRPLMPYLATDFHVLAPDLPGCGNSDKPEEPLSVDSLVSALSGWVAAVGLAQAAFVGHSLGGQIVAMLAERHPELVSRAVLVAPTPDPDVSSAWLKAWWVLADGVMEPPGFIRGAAIDYLRARPDRIWGTLKEALSQDVESRAARIDVPVLVIRGSRDRVVREPWCRRLTGVIPNARYACVEGATHALPAQSPQELARAITAFLHEPGARAAMHG